MSKKIKGLRIAFPRDLTQIKLSTVMKIDAISKDEKLSEITKQFTTLSLFLNQPIELLAKVQMKSIKELFIRMGEMLLIGPEVNFERFIYVGEQEFGFIPDLDAVEGSEFMDMDNLSEDGFANYNKMLAILYRPILSRVGDRYTLIDYMDESNEDKTDRERLFIREMTYSQARGGLYFFLNFSHEFTK